LLDENLDPRSDPIEYPRVELKSEGKWREKRRYKEETDRE